MLYYHPLHPNISEIGDLHFILLFLLGCEFSVEQTVSISTLNPLQFNDSFED